MVTSTKNIILALPILSLSLSAREWKIKGFSDPIALEIVTSKNNFALVKDINGSTFELPLSSFTNTLDREFIQLRSRNPEPKSLLNPGKPLPRSKDIHLQKSKQLTHQFFTPKAASVTLLTLSEAPLLNSSVNFIHADSWLHFQNLKPSLVHKRYFDHFLINGSPAELDTNIRLTRHGEGCLVIPHGRDFPALTIYSDLNLSGEALSFTAYEQPGSEKLKPISDSVTSFILKRGYTATFAQNPNGTGFSKNYVAQDHDIVIKELPSELKGNVHFVRVFPWRWASKKGFAGNAGDKLDVGWYYNWNLNRKSSLDVEYVPIKQLRYWPELKQDWQDRGSTQLLGFNEPDKRDQANLTVDQAIATWPKLLATGLRLGSPSVSDGGLDWLYAFIKKADEKKLRVDFINLHYYRAVNDPGDGKAAAAKFHRFIKNVHDRTQRPIWITEWNNGAGWTKARDPEPEEQADAIQAMIEMLEETEFVERYAPFNWVEACRALVHKDGTLTPAGQVYRDHPSHPAYLQESY